MWICEREKNVCDYNWKKKFNTHTNWLTKWWWLWEEKMKNRKKNITRLNQYKRMEENNNEKTKQKKTFQVSVCVCVCDNHHDGNELSSIATISTK